MLKKTSHILLGTTLALALGAAAFTPAAYAANDDNRGYGKHQRGERGDHRQFGPRRGNPLFSALCGEKSDDRRTKMFSHFEEKIKPTGDQVALWDDLKSTISTASTAFTQSCDPATDTNTDKDSATPPERMAKGIEMMEARIVFASAVLPAFESFYDSLSDDQKAELKKRPNKRGERSRSGRNGNRGGQGNGNGPRGGNNN